MPQGLACTSNMQYDGEVGKNDEIWVSQHQMDPSEHEIMPVVWNYYYLFVYVVIYVRIIIIIIHEYYYNIYMDELLLLYIWVSYYN